MGTFIKQKNVALIVIILCCILTCGCSEKMLPNQETTVQKEKVVLWSYYETEAQQNALDELMNGFNHVQNQYEVTWKYVPMTEFTKKVSIGMTEEELPDIIIIDNPDMKTFIDLEVFEDITVSLCKWEDMDRYYPEILDSVKSDERYYGMPVCCNNLGFIYNKELLEEQGIQPPTNWEELCVCAKALTNDKRFGFAMSALSGEQCAFQVIPWIISEQKNDNYVIRQQDAISGLDKIAYLLDNGWMDANCLNWSQVDIARKFAAGEVAIMENGPWVFPMLQEAQVSYGIVPFATGENDKVLVGGENFGIIKGKNIEGSLAFLEYYNQDEVMYNFCKKANILPAKRELAIGMGEENPELKIFVEQMDSAKARSNFMKWNNISTEISTIAYELFTGTDTPEELVKNSFLCE